MIRGKLPVNDEIILDFGVKYSAATVKKLGLKHDTHQGIDFGCSIGTPCVAYKDGLVQIAHDNGDGYGNRIWLYCDVPNEKKPIRVLYAHLSRMSVGIGMHVKEGQVIGLTGESGKVTGPHLHFEIHQLPEDTVIQPLFYLKREF
jgi:murein DD-endopeptidase MepM/ murein hydrolase activator NlpD